MTRRALTAIGVLIALGLGCRHGMSATQAEGGLPRSEVFTANLDAQGVTDIRLEVPTVAASQRIVFGSMRCTAEVIGLELIDAEGRSAWRADGHAVKLLEAGEAHFPSRGGVYRIAEAEDGKAGRWLLRVQTKKGVRGSVVGAFSVRPTAELVLPQTSPGRPDALTGEQVLVLVMATYRGQPVPGLASVQVELIDDDGRRWTAAAAERLKSDRGVEIELPSGQYVARFRGIPAGKYTTVATGVVNNVRSNASRVLEVGRAQ